MAKKIRAIAEPIVFGKKTYKPGDEDALAAVAPQWNINEMFNKGWLSGDWSDAGLTPEEVVDAAATAPKQ